MGKRVRFQEHNQTILIDPRQPPLLKQVWLSIIDYINDKIDEYYYLKEVQLV